MPVITSTGVGSGLDVDGIVGSLMAINRRPVDLLLAQTSSLKSELSIIGTMKSFMATMRDRAAALTSLSLWNSTTVSTSDATRVRASSAENAAAGRYAVSVISLATTQTATSRAFATSKSTLNEGSLTIELGSWDSAEPPTAFTPKTDDKGAPLTKTVTIPADATSLEKIRDAINAAGAGVTATIVNDASGARLSMTSTETGVENGFRMTASETVDDGDATTGLSALVYDPPGADPLATNSQMTRFQAAQNAQATVNGIPISSASNTLENVADGLTLTLSAVTTADVIVEIGANKEGVRTALNEFVKAYNDLMKNLRDQTKYDDVAKKGGPLQGDSAFVGLQYQLRGVISAGSTATDLWSTLSEVGITQDKEGMLSIKTSDLDEGLDNLPELEKLFAANGDTNSTTGFMRRFQELADLTLGVEGTFESRTSSLNSRIDRNGDQTASMEYRLTQTQARLFKQYETLDVTMARLQSQSNYVMQQLSGLNNNSN